MRVVLIVSLFYRGENQATQRLSNLAKVAQQMLSGEWKYVCSILHIIDLLTELNREGAGA